MQSPIISRRQEEDVEAPKIREFDVNEKEKDRNSMYRSVIALLCYSISSLGMTLNNKIVFNWLGFTYPTLLVLWQNGATVLFLYIAYQFGKISYKAFDSTMALKWFPVNLMFIFMLVSGSFSLNYLSVPMVTVFKNLSTVVVAIGDWYFFGQELSKPILGSSFLIVLSSVIAGYNDLEFNMVGYIVMAFNCVTSAAYLLYMRYVMSKDESTKTFFDQWTLCYYNNLLSLPLLAILSFSEYQHYTSNFEAFNYFQFYAFMIVSAANGLFISVCSLWAIAESSPTTFGIVGALNKIPLTILGFMLFSTPVTIYNLSSVALGTIAGFMFTLSKMYSKR